MKNHSLEVVIHTSLPYARNHNCLSLSKIAQIYNKKVVTFRIVDNLSKTVFSTDIFVLSHSGTQENDL